jgi:hypothetical protein
MMRGVAFDLNRSSRATILGADEFAETCQSNLTA